LVNKYRHRNALPINAVSPHIEISTLIKKIREECRFMGLGRGWL